MRPLPRRRQQSLPRRRSLSWLAHARWVWRLRLQRGGPTRDFDPRRRSEIDAVPESLGRAHATVRTIKQNLFWAFLYNALGVPLAALGFMSPVLCVSAMGLSDLVVIGNALRLRHWRKKT